MKKVIFGLGLLSLGLFSLAGCNDKNTTSQSNNNDSSSKPVHTHNYSSDLRFDENEHYYLCDCGEKKDVQAHTFTNETITDDKATYTCSCGAVKTIDLGYKVTFVLDSHVSIKIYDTQEIKGEGLDSLTCYTRNSDTGMMDSTGDGQVNFVLTFEEGYKFKSCTGDNTKYGKVKGPEDTGVENCYRITKITDDVTFTIESIDNASSFEGYNVTFVLDDGITVTVYPTQDISTGGEVVTTAIAKSGKTGEIVSTTDAQVNFVVNAGGDEYEVATSGEFGNQKQDPEVDGSTNYFRITKIQSDITITITKK